MAQERLIRVDEVVHLTGITKPALYKKMRDGAFPKSIRIGEKASAWVLSDVKKWIDDVIQTQKNKQQ